MKRVRHIYVAEGYGRIDSDDPRLKGGAGLTRAAMYFAERLARKQFGSNGSLIDIDQGEYHRMKPGQRKHMPKADPVGISGIQDFHCLIGAQMGCGIIETFPITLRLRVTRARGSREYYEMR